MDKGSVQLKFPKLSTNDICTFLLAEKIDFEIQGYERDFIGVAQIGRCEEHHLIWSKKISDDILESPAKVIILPHEQEVSEIHIKEKTCIFVENPRDVFRLIILNLFSKQLREAKGLDDSQIFQNSSELNEFGINSVVASRSVIGKNVIIHPGVIIYPGVVIGDNVEICANCVIGAPGFGHVRQANGKLDAFPHLGGVIIENDVSIGSGTCIDSGGLSPTCIGIGTKIGNLTQIAHNVEISENCLIGTRVQIAGGVKIGELTEVWSGSTIANNRVVGARCNVKMGSIVISNLPDNSVVSGNFAVSHEKMLEQFNRLK